jgi:uncharacterized membrane protein
MLRQYRAHAFTARFVGTILMPDPREKDMITVLEFLLIGHFLGVFILVAGLGVATTLGMRSEKISDVKTLKSLMDILVFNGRVVITIGMLLTFVFGIALVGETDHEMSEAWISVAFLLWFLILGLTHAILVKGTKEISSRCDELISEGTTTTTEFQGSALSKKLAMAGVAINIATVVMLYLMVAKPGA